MDKVNRTYFRLSNRINEQDLLTEISGLAENATSSMLYKHSYDTLTKNIDDIFKEVPTNIAAPLKAKLRNNISEFAMYKAKHFTTLLQGDADPKLLRQYYAQLDAEKNLATRSMRSAKQWLDFQETADVYPNLEYLPSLSAEQREEHVQYYGLIRPITDPIWQRILPPNGYNCKCRVRRTDVVPNMPDAKIASLPKGVVGNAAVSERIFNGNHPFFSQYSSSANTIKKNKLKLERKSLVANEQTVNSTVLNGPITIAKSTVDKIISTSLKKEEVKFFLNDLDALLLNATDVLTFPFDQAKKAAKTFKQVHYLWLPDVEYYLVVREKIEQQGSELIGYQLIKELPK